MLFSYTNLQMAYKYEKKFRGSGNSNIEQNQHKYSWIRVSQIWQTCKFNNFDTETYMHSYPKKIQKKGKYSHPYVQIRGISVAQTVQQLTTQ